MLKLKLRFKEVKEEIRELTIEERCLNLVTVALVPGCSKECRAEASAKLDSIGFVSYQGTLGKFRTVTIRETGITTFSTFGTLVTVCVSSYRFLKRALMVGAILSPSSFKALTISRGTFTVTVILSPGMIHSYDCYLFVLNLIRVKCEVHDYIFCIS